MNNVAGGFAVAFGTLLLTPLLAPVVAAILSMTSRTFQRWSLCGLALAIALPWFAIALGLALWKYEANALVLGLGYMSFGVIACSLFRIRPRWIGGLLATLACLPLLAGIFVATVGAIGLGFIVADTVPQHIESPAPGMKCYVKAFGNATTDIGGLEVVVREALPVAFFIERELISERFINPDFKPAEACGRVIHAG